ncbi:MAG: hypothetical protein HQM08_01820 [Candidatus Riflebacteria bacterium]|nr:hypothetical protein [Candidatus Riflebacteria bacterium]
MMQENGEIYEKFVFFSEKKERETLHQVLAMVLSIPLGEVNFSYSDRPDESFSHFNDRTKKILRNLEGATKVEKISGVFEDGGCFELKGGTFTIAVPTDQYNFEVVDSMRRLLSPSFPLCIFRNPFIWGADLYQNYERERFFETRRFIFKSQHLEDPEIDIFRRDEGIIYKIRFHLKEQQETDEGIKFLHQIFIDLLENLGKKSYETMEILFLYSSDRVLFRNFSPRTKLGQRVKLMLYDR